MTISLGVLHNLKLNEIKHSIYEINRVSKQSYIMVESYRNNRELFNLQCWALTCKAFLTKMNGFGFTIILIIKVIMNLYILNEKN